MAPLEPKMFTVTWTRNYYQLGSSNQNVVVVVQSSIQHHHIQNPFFIFIFSKKSSADMTSQKYVESEMPLTEFGNSSKVLETFIKLLLTVFSSIFYSLFSKFNCLYILLLFLCTEKVAPIFQGFHVNTKIVEILI